MTIQAFWLLIRLKNIQQIKDAWFTVDEETNEIQTAYIDEEHIRTATLKGYKNSLDSTLDHLEAKQYIRRVEGGGQVLHAGWHLGQILVGKIAAFLFRSIAVPIIVAFLTALITIWLNLS